MSLQTHCWSSLTQHTNNHLVQSPFNKFCSSIIRFPSYCNLLNCCFAAVTSFGTESNLQLIYSQTLTPPPPPPHIPKSSNTSCVCLAGQVHHWPIRLVVCKSTPCLVSIILSCLFPSSLSVCSLCLCWQMLIFLFSFKPTNCFGNQNQTKQASFFLFSNRKLNKCIKWKVITDPWTWALYQVNKGSYLPFFSQRVIKSLFQGISVKHA